MDELDLRPLLAPGAGAAAIDVFGARVGGPAAPLRGAPLTAADPHQPAGGEHERSLSERVDLTLARGGSLRTADVAVIVEHGRVARVHVRGPALARLGLAHEADIAARFGPPAGHEWTFGCRAAQFPGRDLAVAWHVREDRLEVVQLGGVAGWTEPTLGARDLLALLVESWDLLAVHQFAEPPAEPPPLWHRWRRATALCDALGLGTLAAVATGRFLEHAIRERHAAACERLRAASRLSAGELADDRRGARSLDVTYQHLLRFRCLAEQLLRFNDGWLVCSDPLLLGMINLTDESARPLRDSLAAIDALLVALLDPDARSFPRRDLIARHGWTDVDLAQLDSDWW
jgi:hypothetical protein